MVDTGVVFDPMREELFHAQVNNGAFLNGKKIQTSAVSTMEKAIIATGFYYDRSELMEMTLAAIHKLFKANIQGIRRMGSAALDMCWLAAGRYDGYFEYMLSPWDFAAGMLIVTEAGGIVLDRYGKHNGLLSKGIICSNKSLNRQFVDAVSWDSISRYELFKKDRL
ncbi:MAG: Inositol-1-monophosphatase [Bacteroidetes bacterium ADurb.Bin397]|nr:MAG: Inositol-1-monophosphatase [Bacteroidetes bacterium ADurb.Bin397]